MIHTEHLDFFYRPEHKILEDICFRAEAGAFTAVLGNNGAGKSTLLKCLNRILTPQKGVVFLNGKDLRQMKRGEIARSIAYAAQRAETSRLTVYDTVLLGRKPHMKAGPAARDYNVVEAVLEKLGLQDMALEDTDALSGGELQKVMLARALAQEPKLLLLDEPTSNLDLNNQYEILKQIKKMTAEEQLCVIMVIHDLNLALRYCDRFVFLKDRHILCHGGLECVTPETIQAVYGIPAVLQSIEGIPVVIPLPEQ